MKKIGILTFFYADNYGALLQCYALSKFCEKNDYEVKVIDYHSKLMFTWKYRLKRRIAKSKQNKKFDLNREKFFQIGNIKEFYDIVIVGSDQVWNPSIINGDVYWIEPKLCYKKLISYAASLGKNELTANEETFLENCNFNLYNWISVRETTGQRLLGKTGIKSDVVCDPTLLFYNEPQIYSDIVKNSRLEKNNYIYVYSLEKSDKVDEISRALAKHTGCKIISSHPANSRMQYCDEFIENSDICDFLYLIKNATMVVTNSFHGLAFALIFRKEVFAICHTVLGSRQTDLIEMSGLKYDNLNNGVYHILSYENDNKLRNYIKKSKQLLEAQLERD